MSECGSIMHHCIVPTPSVQDMIKAPLVATAKYVIGHILRCCWCNSDSLDQHITWLGKDKAVVQDAVANPAISPQLEPRNPTIVVQSQMV